MSAINGFAMIFVMQGLSNEGLGVGLPVDATARGDFGQLADLMRYKAAITYTYQFNGPELEVELANLEADVIEKINEHTTKGIAKDLDKWSPYKSAVKARDSLEDQIKRQKQNSMIMATQEYQSALYMLFFWNMITPDEYNGARMKQFDVADDAYEWTEEFPGIAGLKLPPPLIDLTM